jgi:prepilin signal peptidase PulO-like enzyme (type II secretory pathway)
MLYGNLIGFFVFILGLCVGSFLNCVVYRLEQEKSLGGRSFCPRCKHTLGWKDLLPVFSWVFLVGKCRYCKGKISWQYPLVELATGFLFLLVYAIFGQNLVYLLFLLYIVCVFVVIFVYDLKHYLIPDKILFPAIAVASMYRIFGDFYGLPNYILAVIIGSGFFLIIFLISKGNWMGFGDVKLAILMGLLLGVPNILLALFLAFFLGAIIGLMLMAQKKKGLRSEIPFGPFLILGTFLSIFWADKIIQWYLNFFQI